MNYEAVCRTVLAASTPPTGKPPYFSKIAITNDATLTSIEIQDALDLCNSLLVWVGQRRKGTFPRIFGKLGHKKCPQNWTFGKVPQKFQNSWGGGSDLFWKKSIIKLHFFLRTSLRENKTTSKLLDSG